MSDTKIFSVEIAVDEHADSTEAKALLDLGEERYGRWGRARRNPTDPERPRPGDELAMARALNDLAHHLLDEVATQIERVDHKWARLHL